MPSVAGVCPPNEYETFESQQVASDCLWSDPARDNQVCGREAVYVFFFCVLYSIGIVADSVRRLKPLMKTESRRALLCVVGFIV